MKAKRFLKCSIIIFLFSILTSCGKSSEQRIEEVKSGMSISTVINILGTPYKAKRHPMDILVFIYKANKGYYWVYFNEQLNIPTCVFKVEQQNTDDFFPSTDVQLIKKSGRIEFQENKR